MKFGIIKCFGVLTFVAVGVESRSTTLFTDSFEPPTHVSGNAPGNAWTTGNSVISTAQARTGLQSVSGIANAQVQQNLITLHTFAAPTQQFLNLSAWAKTTSGGTMFVTAQFGQSSSSRFVEFGFFSSTNQWFMQVTDASTNVLTSVTGSLSGVSYTSWNELEISHNRSGNSIGFFLNGVQRHTLANASSWVTGDAWVVGLRGNTLGSSTSSRIFFDDVNVESVPEPATLIALGTGVLAALRKRRAR